MATNGLSQNFFRLSNEDAVRVEDNRIFENEKRMATILNSTFLHLIHTTLWGHYILLAIHLVF